MTDSHDDPPAGHGWPIPGDLEDLRTFVIGHVRQVREETGMIDRDAEVLAARVAAVEELLSARWPRRILLAFRLGRRLRASVAHLGYAGGFAARRAEQASLAVHPGGQAVAPAARPGRRGGHRGHGGAR